MTNASETDYTIYSDGASTNHLNAASACIIRHNKTGRQLLLGAYFGIGTNNEAEILALLLGLAALRVKIGKKKTCSLLWVSDSEYSLKSATTYIKKWLNNGWKTADKGSVKNQGLWKFFLAVSDNIELHTKHVRGHSGHRENEICDQIANFLKQFAIENASKDFESSKQLVDTDSGSLDVVCFNATSWLERLRADEPVQEDFEFVLERIAQGLEAQKKEVSNIKIEKNAKVSPKNSRKERMNSLKRCLREALEHIEALELENDPT